MRSVSIKRENKESIPGAANIHDAVEFFNFQIACKVKDPSELWVHFVTSAEEQEIGRFTLGVIY